MTSRIRIIFDTSAINKLSADADCGALCRGLQAGYYVRVTQSNLDEISSTLDSIRRNQLLDLLRTMITEGECIFQFNRIVSSAIKAFLEHADSFDWERLKVRRPQAEAEIVRREFINDDLATKQVEQRTVLKKQFENAFRQMEPSFSPLFQGPSGVRPTLHEFLEQCREGVLCTYAEILFSLEVASPVRQTVMRFYDLCPPFRAAVVAFCVAHYDRCVRDPKKGPSMRAGRLDAMMATYLPYCDVFVSNDSKQLKLLEAVAVECGFDVAVRSYEDFRTRLLEITPSA